MTKNDFVTAKLINFGIYILGFSKDDVAVMAAILN